MNKKKILMSVAAAATIATTFIGCGSDNDGVVASSSTGSSSIVPADGYIYGATASCASGTATLSTDDNKTLTITSSSPGLCSVSGGAHLIGGAYIDSNVTLSAFVPADSNGSVSVTPITTMVAAYAGTNPTAAVLKEAKQKTLSVLGISPAGLTDAQLDAAVNVDTASATALAAAGVGAAQKAKVVALFTALDTLKTSGASASSLTAALKGIVNGGSTTGANDKNTTQMLDTMSAIIPSSEINATVLASVKAISESTENALKSLALDSIESKADASIKAASELKATVAAGTSVTTAQMDSNITAANTAIQAALAIVYLDHVTGTSRLDLNGTGVDTNASYDYNGSISNFPVAKFKLNDQNVSDMNYTADISALFQNEGNANYSFKVMFKDVPVVASGATYTFTTANNTNVSYAGKGFDGVVDTYQTVDANTVSGGDTNGTLVGAIGTTSPTDMNLSQIATWTYEKLVASGSGAYNANASNITAYGINANWSSTIILNLNSNTSAVTLYKKQADGDFSQSATAPVTVETQKTGAVIFNGRFY